METQKTVIDYCDDCGAVVCTLDSDYVQRNPNASDMFREQQLMEHRETYHFDLYNVEIKCWDCHEVLRVVSQKYYSENPNGFEMFASQARENHVAFCDAAWSDWRDSLPPECKLDGITPRQAVRILLEKYPDKYQENLPDISTPPDRTPGGWIEELRELLNTPS